MVQNRTFLDHLVDAVIYIVLAFLCLICIAPFIHVIALSFSSRKAIGAAEVGLWPVGFNVINYRIIASNALFIGSFGISLARVVFGVGLGLLVTAVTAYPLSRDNIQMPGRLVFKGLMIFSMLFSGGLIPTYLAMQSLGLMNKFWILILPGAFNVFFVILIINFFRGLPYEMYEAAILDGASHFDILLRIFLPLSLPSLATVTLFSAVSHWNSWFDGLLYMKEAAQWPLQTLMYVEVSSRMPILGTRTADQTAAEFQELTPEGSRAAMLLMATLPILLVYPFLQRYFVTGLTLGSVKG